MTIPGTNRGARAGLTRGFTLFEVVAALILLGVLLGFTLKTLSWIAAEQRDAARRQLALHALANLLERAAATPFESLNERALAAWTIPDDAKNALPDAVLSIRVAAVGDAKRVAARLDWTGRSGVREAPCRITAFFYPGLNSSGQ